MTDMPQPRPGIMDIKPYIGGEGRAEGITDPLRLASNENVLGASPKAVAAYQAAARDLHRYPDGMATELRLAIGRAHGLDAEKIICGAGSEELIMQIIRAYAGPGDEVIHSQYGFLMYPIQARAAGAKPVSVPEANMQTDIQGIIRAVTAKTKMVIIANPNNPTGSLLTAAQMRELRAGLPSHVLLVIDSAYAEFVTGGDYDDGRTLVDAAANTVMLRTFSKIYGLAAVRLGWGYFPPEIGGVINRIRGAFNVSVPAQAAGIAALDDRDFIQRTIDMTVAGRDMLTKGLEKMGYHVYPSAGNFLLVEFGPDAETLRLGLKTEGIFIRQMGAYSLPHHLRITVGTEVDNDRLLAAIARLRESAAA